MRRVPAFCSTSKETLNKVSVGCVVAKGESEELVGSEEFEMFGSEMSGAAWSRDLKFFEVTS